MKKILFTGKIIILITLLFILNSCTKPEETYTITEENGVEVISNSGLPNQPKRPIKLKEIFTLEGYDEMNNPDENAFFYLKKMTVTPDGSIYIYDETSYRVTKYSNKGEYELSFLKQGKGPGEILEPQLVKIFSSSENIIIQEYIALHFFDLDGNFLETKMTNVASPPKLPLDIMPLPNKQIMTTRLGLDVRGENYSQDGFLVRDIALCDSLLNQLSVLPETIDTAFKDLEKDVEDSFINKFTIAVSDNELYVHNRSKREYLIECYDLELKKTRIISMPTNPIKYNQNELEYIEDNFVGNYASEKYWKEIFDTKLCLNYLHFDKNNNLLIAEKVPSLDTKSVSFDVFRDGVYLNSFEYEIDPEDYHPMNQDFMFKVQDGRFYAYSETQNAVRVFELETF